MYASRSCRTHDLQFSTRRNASSPLFQLPAELRNQIWTMAYGFGSIHIDHLHHTRLCTKDHTLTWKPCVESDACGRHVKCLRSEDTISIPLVSKQFWAEAIPIFCKTNVFHFEHPPAFRDFALRHSKLAERIVAIKLTRLHVGSARCFRWESALTAFVVGHFKSLKRIKIDKIVTPRDLHFLRRSAPRGYSTLMAFQQHQLEEQHTSCRIVLRATDGTQLLRGGGATTPTITGIESAMKAQLLDHQRRRRSQRQRR